MKTRTLLIGLSTAMIGFTPIVTSFTPQAKAGTVTEINDSTIGQLRKSQNREGFVKVLANKAFYFHNGKFNVMVFNMQQGYSSNLQGVQYFKHVEYNGVNYGLWVFKKGTFTNTGDGSYINWNFMGKFNRGGKNNRVVTFTSIS
jgi:hypothetical protein